MTIIDTDFYEKSIIKFSNEKEYIDRVLKLKDFKKENKVAILYSGNLRSFKYVFENHKKLFKQINDKGYEYDLFYQVFDDENMIFLDNFKDGITINGKMDFSVNEEEGLNLFSTLQQIVSQMYGWYNVFNRFIEFQNKNNTYYEYVVRIRYDITIETNKNIFNFADDNNIYSLKHLAMSVNEPNYMINDRLFYGKQHNMYYPMNTLCFINNYRQIHVETLLGKVIVHNNLKISYIDDCRFTKPSNYLFLENYNSKKNNELNIFIYVDNLRIKVNIDCVNKFFINLLDNKLYMIDRDCFNDNIILFLKLLIFKLENLKTKEIEDYVSCVLNCLNFMNEVEYKFNLYCNVKLNIENVNFYQVDENCKNSKYYRLFKFLNKNITIDDNNMSMISFDYYEGPDNKIRKHDIYCLDFS